MKDQATNYLTRRNALLLLSALPLSQLSACSRLGARNETSSGPGPIEIEYPEVYELSNIILALTPHGIEDKWQVRKDFPFYETMRAYFEPFRSHPVIEAANFSRELWKEYLSFRTDAYAFQFAENGTLERTYDFQAFDIQMFDENLEAVQDFADASNFRNFFESHLDFRERIIAEYRRYYLIQEMRRFLDREFGDFFSDKRYVVALSPFVYAQNLHRDVSDSLTVDFPTIAGPILNSEVLNEEEQASEIHTLFTEMDHGYVNPTSDRYADRLNTGFDDRVWSKESGYENYPRAVFHEYMTWAVFDLFVKDVFPAYADQVSFDWHIQNESRGFIYSYTFARTLLQLRDENPNTQIKHLYPALIDQLSKQQLKLSKPSILNDGDDVLTSDIRNTWIEFTFSEPMQRARQLSVSIREQGYDKQQIELSEDDMRWNDELTALSIRLSAFERPFQRAAILLNDFGSMSRVFSQKGVLLTGLSRRFVVSE